MAFTRKGADFKQLKKTVKEIESLRVSIGWHRESQYVDGTLAGDVAMYNEFGSESRPPRPFFSRTHENNKEKWKKYIRIELKKCISGKIKPKMLYEKLGLLVEGDIRESIQTFEKPPLAAATIKKKGFDKPLVDTGFMLRSVASEVEKK